MSVPTVTRARGLALASPVVTLAALVGAVALTSTASIDAKADPPDGRDHARLARHDDPTELRVVDWVLWYVAKYYVEPGRVDPTRMTLAGLDALESSIPEVLIETVTPNDRVRVHVRTTSREFEVRAEAPWGVAPRLREVFRFIDANTTLDDDERRDAEYAMIEGLLSTLDPHTNLLRPDDFEDMRTSTKGSFGGLGIEIGMREGKLTILRVIDGNPAARAGLLAGDQIVQIDDESAVTMVSDEAVTRLRGAPGTKVVLHVRRIGQDKPMRFVVTRDVIKLDSVVAEVLPGLNGDGSKSTVGYVQIPKNFAQTTGKELRDKLQDFERQGVRGVILDMRRNPGGLLSAAVEVADAFVGSGTIVSTVGHSQPREESRATTRYDFPALPVVVLVDEGSASATEIVAGALRNLDRAVVIGRRTFGKGSVQVLHDRRVGNQDLALKLTIAQYLTPGDVSIQSVGVSPDIETIPVWLLKDNVFWYGTRRFDGIREESLAAHLDNASATRERPLAPPIHFFDAQTSGELEADDAAITSGAEHRHAAMLLHDPEVRLARDLVLWAPGPRRSEIIGGIATFVADQTAKEEQRLRAQMQKRGIDWDPGTAPTASTAAQLRTSIDFSPKDATIRGGQSGTLTMTVHNDGDAPAFQVRAMSSSDYAYFDERELIFGRIDPGQSRSATLKLSVGEYERSRVDRIDFDVFERHGATLGAASVRSIDVVAQGLPRPQFAYGIMVLDDPAVAPGIVGNGDGILQVGEKVELRVDVANRGHGPALDTVVSLRNYAGEVLFVENALEKIGKLANGAHHTVSFRFEVKKAPASGEAALQLSVIDNKLDEAATDRLVFAVEKTPSVALTSASGRVELTRETALHIRPTADAPRSATAPAGTVLEVTGKANGWLKVSLTEKRFGFVLESDTVAGAKGRPNPSGVVAELAVTPPTITLSDVPLKTESTRINVSGTASHARRVEDVFITVRNPSRGSLFRRDKVYYLASTDPTSGRLEFSGDVPLEPGNNEITVYARENEQVVAVRSVWVLRTSGLAEARAAERILDAGGKLSVDKYR